MVHYQRDGLPSGTYSPPNKSPVPGQLHVQAREIANVSSISAQMPSTDAAPSKSEIDSQRLACLPEWTAFCTHLDLQPELVENSPYRFLASAKTIKRSHGWTRTTGEPCADPHNRALEVYTKALDYLRLRHEPVDEDSVSIDTVPDSACLGRSESKRLSKSRSGRRRMRKRARASLMMTQISTTYPCCLLRILAIFAKVSGKYNLEMASIIKGSRYPLMLRGVGNEERYTVVGKAHAHGALQKKEGSGEIWDPSAMDHDPMTRELILV